MYPHSARRKKARTSPLWNVFVRLSPGVAKCGICRNSFSFKSSNSNLKRHLFSKHPKTFDKIWGKPVQQDNKDSPKSIKRLISLVKLHPCLWDTRSDTYGNEQLQSGAWNKIASRLYPTEEKVQVVTKIAEQFNELRNAFFSNLHCAYFNQLTFLTPLLNGNDKQSTFSDIDENVSKAQNQLSLARYSCVDESPINKEEPSKQNFPRSHEEEHSQTPMKCSLKIININEDALFLLSLVDEMKQVPREFEMDFKAELLMEFNKMLKRYTDGLQ